MTTLDLGQCILYEPIQMDPVVPPPLPSVPRSGPAKAPKQTWVIVVLALLGLALVVVIALGALVAFIVTGERTIQMPREVKAMLLTEKDVDDWSGGTVEPGEREQTLVVDRTGHHIATYTWDSPDLWIFSEVTYGGLFATREDEFAETAAILKGGKDPYGEGVVGKRDDQFLKWGERSAFSHLLDEKGERTGFHFYTHYKKHDLEFRVIGVRYQEAESLKWLLSRRMKAFKEFVDRPKR